MSAPPRPFRRSGCRLADPAEEAAYRASARAAELQVAMVAFLVCIFNVAFFAGADRRFAESPRALWILWASRAAYVAVAVAGLVAVRRTRTALARDLVHFGLSALLAVETLIIYASRPPDWLFHVASDIGIVYATWSVLTVPFAWQAAAAALHTASFAAVVVLFRAPLPTPAAVAMAVAFLTAHVVGAFTSWNLHVARREAWWRGREEAARRAEAEAANREKSVFLGSVSHELLPPVGGLVAAAEAIERGGGRPDPAALARLREEGAALRDLLTDVLDLARGEAVAPSVERRPASVGALLSDVHQSLAWRAEAKGVALRRRVAPEVPGALLLDPRRLRQLVLNLAANALRVTARGEVAVAAACEPAGPGRVTLRVEVADTGPGIPADQLARVFEPFWQAPGQPDAQRGGAGLGLAVAALLARQLGGRVEVESRPGEGSRFTVILPEIEVVAAAAEAEAPAPASEPRAEAALVAEAVALAEVPHVARAVALAQQAERDAAALGDAALAGWAAEVRTQAQRLDAAALSAVLRRLRPRAPR